MSRNTFSLARASMGNPSLWTLVKELESMLQGCETVLDVGCGNASPLRFVPRLHLTGLDGYAPSLEQARKAGTHDEYVLGDVRRIGELFAGKHFDATVGLDVIEHLPKEDGWRMLESMEKVATKRVVIFTPNGFVPQKSREGDLQEHLSGWTAEDLRPRGYRVLGMGGPKGLRGEFHIIKYQPRIFWAAISVLAQGLYTRNHPETAAAILCTKAFG